MASAVTPSTHVKSMLDLFAPAANVHIDTLDAALVGQPANWIWPAGGRLDQEDDTVLWVHEVSSIRAFLLQTFQNPMVA